MRNRMFAVLLALALSGSACGNQKLVTSSDGVYSAETAVVMTWDTAGGGDVHFVVTAEGSSGSAVAFNLLVTRYQYGARNTTIHVTASSDPSAFNFLKAVFSGTITAYTQGSAYYSGSFSTVSFAGQTPVTYQNPGVTSAAYGTFSTLLNRVYSYL